MMRLSNSSTDLATFTDTYSCRRSKLLKGPQAKLTRTTGKPAEGNETRENPKTLRDQRTTSCLIGDMQNKHHEPVLRRVHQGTFNASWCPPAGGGSSVPTLSNEVHILRRRSENYRQKRQHSGTSSPAGIHRQAPSREEDVEA